MDKFIVTDYASACVTYFVIYMIGGVCCLLYKRSLHEFMVCIRDMIKISFGNDLWYTQSWYVWWQLIQYVCDVNRKVGIFKLILLPFKIKLIWFALR